MPHTTSRRLFLAGGAALASAGPAWAKPADAAAAVAEAAKQASASNRRLLLVFHASWCGYCKVFDMMLADRKAGAIVDRHFQVYHLRAREKDADQRSLQLAGADDVFRSFVSESAGLPYMAVLDEKAGKITDSMMSNGDNFGFPVTPQELVAFDEMLKVGAPGMTTADRRVLGKTCVSLVKPRN
jgi:hypothetical protein